MDVARVFGPDVRVGFDSRHWIDDIHSVLIVGKRASLAPTQRGVDLDFLIFQVEVGWPNKLIFSDNVMRKIMIISRFLLVWRRLTWDLTALQRQLRGARVFLVHAFHMIEFVRGFSSFLNEAELAFAQLLQKLTTSPHVTEVIAAGEALADDVTRISLSGDEKALNILAGIAESCVQVIDDARKWASTATYDGMTPCAQMRLGQPMQTLHQAFEQRVRSLVRLVKGMTDRNADNVYAGLREWVDFNRYYDARSR
jgi:hypothetical protein